MVCESRWPPRIEPRPPLLIFELRRYRVASGRLPDVRDRFVEHLPPLFARHHLNVLGRWTATASEDSASFVYLLGFERLDARQSAWAGFYIDPQWQRVRTSTNAGSEMIERTGLSFLSPSAACDGLDSRRWSGGVHELVDQRVAIGQKAAVEAFFADVYVPALRASGADVLWLAEAITGEDLPQFSYILRWRNSADRRAAQPLLESAARLGASLLLGARAMEMNWVSS
ncbi:NIPSNAP family protein [Peristeroidobacter soli]|uniref:NIPSNAP family protein n=1 Tax=Peristeroidobacter soli TaxID=2497877 RepID=UPI0024822952|nr:NIPSNAP family protein [Peristeroidobacter soli]